MRRHASDCWAARYPQPAADPDPRRAPTPGCRARSPESSRPGGHVDRPLEPAGDGWPQGGRWACRGPGRPTAPMGFRGTGTDATKSGAAGDHDGRDSHGFAIEPNCAQIPTRQMGTTAPRNAHVVPDVRAAAQAARHGPCRPQRWLCDAHPNQERGRFHVAGDRAFTVHVRFVPGPWRLRTSHRP